MLAWLRTKIRGFIEKRRLDREIHPDAFRTMASELVTLAELASRVRPEEQSFQLKARRIRQEMQELTRMGCCKDVVNKAAVSNTTSKILKTLDPVVRMKPEKVFILEGINELYSSNDSIIARYREILRRINTGSPNTMSEATLVTTRRDSSNQVLACSVSPLAR